MPHQEYPIVDHLTVDLPPSVTGDVFNKFISATIRTPFTVKAYVPEHIIPQYSDFVKVYRVVIEYVNPLFRFKRHLGYNTKDIGIPVVLINPINNKHIETFYDFTVWEDFLNGFVLSGSKESDLGYPWITNTQGTVLDWTLRSKGGSNHGRGLGNVYGRKLIIEELTKSHYRQIYEFVGAKNEHFDEIHLGLFLPVYDTGTTTMTPIIKNIALTCDVLTTTNGEETYILDARKKATINIPAIQERR